MRLTINLATRTYLNSKQLNLVFAAVFILLLLLCLINVKHIVANIEETGKISSELRNLEQKSGSKGRKIPEAEYQALASQIGHANSIIYRKTYNWLQLLDKLENVVPDGVSLNNIAPDSKGQSLKLTGTSLTFARLRQLLEKMEESSDFKDIYLISQADTRVGETQKGVTFTITCQVKM